MKNINISGAKNAVLPILAATLLKKNLYYIKNIPLVSDMEIQLEILKQFNVKVWFFNKNNLIIDSTNLIIPQKIDYSQNTRGTYYFIGSTVIYDKDLEYILETGCKIDERKIDYHIKLLELLGKTVSIDGNKLMVKGQCNYIDISYSFPKPSVGATINAIFMFSKTKYLVTLKNFAKDPYIFNTISLLKKIGINIYFNNEFIIINGLERNNKNKNNQIIDHTIMEDPIEALTYIIYSGIHLKEFSISEYTIGPINIYNLGSTYFLLESIGIFLVKSKRENCYYIKKTKLLPFEIYTDFFPKIYTDIQPMLAILSLFIENGKSIIREKIWNDRFKYINEINNLGYNIIKKDNEIIIDNTFKSKKELNKGVDLEKKELNCTDLRGGMALLLLMRSNNINKDPNNKNFIDRGYYNYENNIKIILNSQEKYYNNFSTKNLSNIKIGGITKYYTEVFLDLELMETLSFCYNNKIKYKIIGDGNNIYFSEFYDGMIIKNLIKKMVYTLEEEFIVSSGTPLLDFVIFAAEKKCELSNLAGIPGTIGGAIYGNAGAYGLEIKDLLTSCKIMSLKNKKIKTLEKKDINFDYRSSCFKQEKNEKNIILSGKFKIKKSNFSISEIKSKIKDKIIQRNQTIPIENTLGSIFKNIITNNNKIYAWELLDELNLRGSTINNIILNKNHPNIFINNGHASPRDLNYLIEKITFDIFKKKNLHLEKEIEYIN